MRSSNIWGGMFSEKSSFCLYVNEKIMILDFWDYNEAPLLSQKGHFHLKSPRKKRFTSKSELFSIKYELLYRLCSFEPLFSTNLWFWGYFLIILVLALERKIAKKWMLMINFSIFFCTRSTKKHIDHNIGMYFLNFV